MLQRKRNTTSMNSSSPSRSAFDIERQHLAGTGGGGSISQRNLSRHILYYCLGGSLLLLVFYFKSIPKWNPISSSTSSSSSNQKFELSSTAFEDGSTIPMTYARSGRNVSPPLSWTNQPPSTESFALIIDDPDAPTPYPWVHWILYNIPSNVNHLAEDFVKTAKGNSKEEEKDDNALYYRQGQNSWNLQQYDGPQPPKGQNHRYIFILYALDTTIEGTAASSSKSAAAAAAAGGGGDKTNTITKDQLLDAMSGHILGQAQWTGRFQSQ